jgi:UDP-GlcNAc:undecaprenyl-phosphate GlcNAc-1-phosphate transferase
MWLLIFCYIFAFSLILSLLFNKLFLYLSQKWRITDLPGERKIHKTPKPLLGGAGIYLAFIFTVCANILLFYFLFIRQKQPPFFVFNWLNQILSENQLSGLKNITSILLGIKQVGYKLFALLSAGTIIFLIGLWDDLRNIKPWIKICGQILAALILIMAGIKVSVFIHNEFLTGIITILWIVGITNAFNLLDNMDGLSAGVAVISCFLFFAVVIQEGQFFISLLLISFIGSLLGFLKYNLYPSRMFMGDAGSMFTGFMIAALTVISTFVYQNHHSSVAIIMPILILSVPIFDTLSVVFIRIKKGKPIFIGDTNHFSHRLVNLGMNQREAVFFVYMVTLGIGLGALLLKNLNLWQSIIVLIQTFVIFGLIVALEAIGKKDKY